MQRQKKPQRNTYRGCPASMLGKKEGPLRAQLPISASVVGRARTSKAGETRKVINIMDALKKSMYAKGQAKVKDAVRKRMGKAAPKRVAQPTATKARSGSRRSLH